LKESLNGVVEDNVLGAMEDVLDRGAAKENRRSVGV